MVRLACAVIGLGSIAAAVGLHGALDSFVDLASLLVVLVPSLALTAAGHGPKSLGKALCAGVGGRCAAPEEGARATLQTLRNLLCCAGAVGTLLGLILMLQSLDDLTAIGPAMAVALLSALYGLLFGELMVAPMIARLDSDDAAPVGAGARGAVLSLFAVLTCSGLVLLLVAIMPTFTK